MADKKTLRADLLEELLVERYISTQKELEELGILPAAKKGVIDTRRPFVEMLGALQLGFFIASISIFANFVVVNLLFHLER